MLPSQCPSCQGPLDVAKLGCRRCHAHLEGRFPLPALLRLAPEDQRFVLDFVRASGSLKDVAKLYGQSYPTIRSRLNAIIEALSEAEPRAELARHAILDQLANGELSVAEAAQLLKEAT